MREYHHIGYPTDEVHEDEVYHDDYKYYSTPFEKSPFRIQFHRFEKDSPLPKALKEIPHVAFKVDDLDKELEGKEVILGPYSFTERFRSAVILELGVPIELIETDLTDEELANRQKEFD